MGFGLLDPRSLRYTGRILGNRAAYHSLSLSWTNALENIKSRHHPTREHLSLVVGRQNGLFFEPSKFTFLFILPGVPTLPPSSSARSDASHCEFSSGERRLASTLRIAVEPSGNATGTGRHVARTRPPKTQADNAVLLRRTDPL